MQPNTTKQVRSFPLVPDLGRVGPVLHVECEEDPTDAGRIALFLTAGRPGSPDAQAVLVEEYDCSKPDYLISLLQDVAQAAVAAALARGIPGDLNRQALATSLHEAAMMWSQVVEERASAATFQRMVDAGLIQRPANAVGDQLQQASAVLEGAAVMFTLAVIAGKGLTVRDGHAAFDATAVREPDIIVPRTVALPGVAGLQPIPYVGNPPGVPSTPTGDAILAAAGVPTRCKGAASVVIDGEAFNFPCVLPEGHRGPHSNTIEAGE